MARTTISLDAVVLDKLRRRAADEGKTLGQLASELLDLALARDGARSAADFHWISRPMGAKINLDDAESLRRA